MVATISTPVPKTSLITTSLSPTTPLTLEPPYILVTVGPAVDVYAGEIVGIHNRDNDLNVNPCKNKEMSNTRSKASDDAIALVPPRTFTLEESLEFIEDDEYVEITPDAIRLRKKILDANERFRLNRK